MLEKYKLVESISAYHNCYDFEYWFEKFKKSPLYSNTKRYFLLYDRENSFIEVYEIID